MVNPTDPPSQPSSSTLQLPPELTSFLLNPSTTPNSVTSLIPLKLTKENYLLWKDVVTLVLQNYDMISLVDDSENCPPKLLNNEVNPAYTQWQKRDRTCKLWLTASISEPVLPFTVGSTSARSLWLNLEHRFASITRSHVLQLRRRIQTIQKGNNSVTEYLQHIKEIADALAAAGEPLDDSDVVAHTLHGLTPEYEAFNTSIRVRAEPVSADELHGLLLSQEVELELRTNPQPRNYPVQAFATSSSFRPRTQNRGPNPIFRPNRPRFPNPTYQPRHSFPNSHLNPPLLPTPPHPFYPPFPYPSRSRPHCTICGLNNHRAPECYHRWNHIYQGRQPPARFATSPPAPPPRNRNNSDQSQPAALLADATRPNESFDPNSSLWYIDSGATHHITSDLSNINSPNAYPGFDRVSVGNGQGFENRESSFSGAY